MLENKEFKDAVRMYERTIAINSSTNIMKTLFILFNDNNMKTS